MSEKHEETGTDEATEGVPASGESSDSGQGDNTASEERPETKQEGQSGPSDDRDAEIAELRRQLEEAKPILQAHADAEERNKSELQKANERAESLEAELRKLREEAARARVAEKTGLPSDVVALLNGATEEDLLRAAEKVAKAKPKLHTRPAPSYGSGPSKGDEGSGLTDPRKLAEAIRKRMPY